MTSDLPVAVTSDQQYLSAITRLLIDIRDRLPAPPAAQPEPESPVVPIAIREPATATPPQPEPIRPARAGNRRRRSA